MRQQVLYLWTSSSSLDGAVIGWAFHDGTPGSGPGLPAGDPPYATGVDALRDGWFLLQSSQLVPTAVGDEHTNTFLEYEFVFERRVDTGAPAPGDTAP